MKKSFGYSNIELSPEAILYLALVKERVHLELVSAGEKRHNLAFSEQTSGNLPGHIPGCM